MENIKASSLKTKQEVIGDLKELLQLVNDSKEGYKSAADATESADLKALFSKLSGERIVYAAELKEHIALHGEDAVNEAGGILGGLHRSWLAIKQVLSNNDNLDILKTITTGERAAIEKYDVLIADYADHADHMKLLAEQRDGVQAALAAIEKEIVIRNED
ncbi:PA2169 family four-helix-bundle protein [Mucilaginibacter ginsenosidivorax]|uniref:PA2169 family four-helix-bundle protein n=1 Tax=Mucilaginibacter ginsenosidivorax TaxID=862126 RepID=A0A5B8VSZ3_9SPHI|nr:PA2169 family four-helix-bundle protein [Mucilaginibacter ginsenosidivorax]QEC74717.1 PA2169 family four-helix-bundle protein [Mucilaginibacter ginsenosidivorax]